MTVRLVTVSERRAKAKCSRLHFIRYTLGYRPVKDAPALRFGTLGHAGLEAWWDALSDAIAILRERGLLPADWYDPSMLTEGMKMAILEAAMAALRGEPDPYERAKATAMLEAYHARWIGEAIEPLAVEWTLDESPENPGTPVTNPFTGDEVVDFRQGGKLDVLVRKYRPDGTSGLYVAEHKSASGDVSVGSPYRAKLAGDPQISTYHDSVQALGYPNEGVIYDILVKPDAPKRATPIEKRLYTEAKWILCPVCRAKPKKAAKGAEPVVPDPPPHKIEIPAEDDEPARVVMCEEGPAEDPRRRVCKDPGGRLHQRQRAEDEAPDAYLARIRADIAAAPDAFLVRQEIARLDGELEQHRKDAYVAAVAIVQAEAWHAQEAARPGSVPQQFLYSERNPDQCRAYGRECEYLNHCYNGASLDDPAVFRKVSEKHGELLPVVRA